MAEIFRDDKIALRECILYEVLDKRPIFDSYKSLCKRLGNDAIEYIDFEYWYMRFVNGKLDLNYDRSLDPKPLAFSELPIEIIGKFVDKLNLTNRIRIRRVSRLLRNIVDTQKAARTKLGFSVYDDEIILEIEKSISTEQNSFENKDYVGRALHDLAVVLKNPKLHLDEFSVVFDYNAGCVSRCLEFIETTLKSRKCPLRVTLLHMEVYPIKGVMRVLPYLKAVTLEALVLRSVQQEEIELDELMKMDHWKMLKSVSLYGYLIPTPIDCFFFRFNSYTIEIDTIPHGELIRLRDAASKSPNFEYCLLISVPSQFRVADIGRVLGAAIQDPEIEKIVHRHPSPNSKSFIEITIVEDSIFIEKKV